MNESNDLSRLSRETGELALMATALLAEELSGGGDTKRAKELSGIVKEMAGLAQSLRGNEPKELTVIFAPGTDDAAV